MTIDLEAITARYAAYDAAFNAGGSGRAWGDPVAGTAIDCTGDVPELVAEVKRLTAIVEAVEKVRDEWAVTRLVSGGSRAPIATKAADLVVQQLTAALSSVPGLSEASGGTKHVCDSRCCPECCDCLPSQESPR